MDSFEIVKDSVKVEKEEVLSMNDHYNNSEAYSVVLPIQETCNLEYSFVEDSPDNIHTMEYNL